mgnify:FL=1
MREEQLAKRKARIKSYRMSRLNKDSVTAIDDIMDICNELHTDISEGVYHGFLGIRLDQIIKLRTALDEMEWNFKMPEEK